MLGVIAMFVGCFIFWALADYIDDKELQRDTTGSDICGRQETLWKGLPVRPTREGTGLLQGTYRGSVAAPVVRGPRSGTRRMGNAEGAVSRGDTGRRRGR